MTAAPQRALKRWASVALLVTIVVGSGACGRRTATAPASSDPQARSQMLIESGNQAFSAGNYGLAARRYAAAAVIKQDDPAAYYGLGMALAKLGRDEDARAAYAKARALTRK